MTKTLTKKMLTDVDPVDIVHDVIEHDDDYCSTLVTSTVESRLELDGAWFSRTGWIVHDMREPYDHADAYDVEYDWGACDGTDLVLVDEAGDELDDGDIIHLLKHFSALR